MQIWWTEQTGVWFALLAVSGPLVPFLVWQAKRGRHRQAVLRTWIAVVVTYSIITIAGAIAVAAGQPTYVWIPLVFAGFFTALPYAATYHVMKSRYTEIELRRARARDL
jgi:CHASE2 domain-containing sensor protein